MNEKATLFDNVFNANTNRRTETTMTQTKTATKPLPIDDGDLSDMEAIAAMLREAHEDRQLIKARLDGITEALGTLASDFKTAVAARAAQHTAAAAAPAARSYAAAPAGGGGATGGKRVTWGLVDVIQKTVAKRAGGTFEKTVAVFSNGYERDLKSNFVNYFTERIGQEVSFTEAKPPGKNFNEIVAVG